MGGRGLGTVGCVFFIFGLKSSDRRLAAPVLLCAYCGAQAAQVLIRRTTKFSLFFIPLFPVRPARHYMQCTNCATATAVDPRDVDRLTV